MVKIIDGRNYAKKLKALIREELEKLGPKPGLAIIQVGDNPASQVYVGAKTDQAAEIGIRAKHYHFPEATPEEQLIHLIDQLNKDEQTHGIILQLPLPTLLKANNVIDRILPQKDVDGLTTINAGRLSKGLPGLVPCTPLGCLLLLRSEIPRLMGLHAVIVGRSNLVGKPMAQILLQQDCTVTTLHSKSSQPEELAKQADIIIVAAGSPGLVNETWIKKGAIVLDVGISRDAKGSLQGDVLLDPQSTDAAAITPVPGGIGPMTVACLLYNTTIAMALQLALPLKLLKPNPLRDPICLSSQAHNSKN